MNASWKATADYPDATAKGGWARTNLTTTKVTRAEADQLVRATAAVHVAVKGEGHTLAPEQRYPGKTHLACSCRAAFHAAGLRDAA